MTKNKSQNSRLFKKIGKKIAYARVEILKITQKEFAARLGYKDPSLLSQIENGHKSPFQKLPQIAQITGMKISWFLEDETEKDAKEWKANQYDYYREILEKIFGFRPGKNHVEMTEKEKEQEFERLGIIEPDMKDFCKIWPFLDEREKQNALQLVKVFVTDQKRNFEIE